MGQSIVFLSPHLDDVVLSCGDLLLKEKEAGKNVCVLNIFSGIFRGEDIPLLAKKFHERWNHQNEVVEMRLMEDDKALQYLGVRKNQLGYLDCIYRKDTKGRDRVISEEEIFNADIGKDQELILALTKELRAWVLKENVKVIYAPLGIGGHIDHHIVRNCVCNLNMESVTIIFYEDVPYVMRQEEDAWRKNLTKALHPLLIPIKETWHQKKIEAIRLYASQIFALWKDEKDFLETMVRHNQREGGLRAIRLWTMKPSKN